MKILLAGTTALSLALALAPMTATAQEDQERSAREGTERNESTERQQAVRGTIAGVTTIGEAVIDPSTNTAVIVEADYLTVLGSPMGGRGARSARGTEAPQRGEDGTAARGRENVYLVAITPATTVHEGQAGERRPGQRGAAQREADQRERSEEKPDQAASRTAFQKLEIGDRVEIRFEQTENLRRKAGTQAQNNQAASTDGSAKSKHGRSRIVVGEASSVTLLPTRTAAARNPQREGDER